jgi:O-acetyl-ADP-ribose deacetylase (regulator of RNase III)
MDRPNIYLVDRDPAFVDSANEAFQGCPGVVCVHADVRVFAQQLRSRGAVAFVSPANSLGFMDGGIDFAYSRHMFPGVEGTVRSKIRALGFSGCTCVSFGRSVETHTQNKPPKDITPSKL